MSSTSPLLGLKLAPLSNAPRTLTDLAEGKATVRRLVTRETPAGETLVIECRAFLPTDDGPHPFFSVLGFRVPGLPRFALLPRPRFGFGLKPIDFASHPQFSKRFLLRTSGEESAAAYFTPSRLDACLALPKRPSAQVESGGGWLLVCSELVKEKELGSWVEQCAKLAVGLGATD